MREHFWFVLVCLVLSLAIVACDSQVAQDAENAADSLPPEPANAQAVQTADRWTGKVVETMNSGGYTYVLVEAATEQIWAAAPEFEVEVGDAVQVPGGAAMVNFRSNTLDRTFKLIYFVNAINVEDADQATAGQLLTGSAALKETGAVSSDFDFSGIEKVEGGCTVEEVFAGKEQLAGQSVKVRGIVVKFSPQIMGKNWIHLQDGTGGPGANDLTVTTGATVKVGDLVVVNGALVLDKDFGFGYQYNVLIEDAAVTVEVEKD